MGDDDTFFPSPNAFVDQLAGYNTSRLLYVGTLSEDVNAIDQHGSQAFGGAGVFLSVPMAAEITKHFESGKSEEKVQKANSGWDPQEDILLRMCIYENADVRLSAVRDIWQLNVIGDLSGFYESGIKPLSLPYYRGGMWHTAYPLEYTKISRMCGEDCFVLSTGFCTAHSPLGIDFDTNRMERGFHADHTAPGDKLWNFDTRLGRRGKIFRRRVARSRESCKKTPSWTTASSARSLFGTLMMRVWKDQDGNPTSQVGGIIELVWIL